MANLIFGFSVSAFVVAIGYAFAERRDLALFTLGVSTSTGCIAIGLHFGLTPW